MPLPPEPFLVDAHEDLACHCQEYGRDLAEPGEVSCMITLPWLQRSGMRLVLATLFSPHDKEESERRYKLYSQLSMYEEWFELFRGQLVPIRTQRDLLALAEAAPISVNGRSSLPIGVVLLMEGCDLLASAAEMQTWFERGVRAAGLTWNGRNRFASGTFSDGKGLTSEGRELLAEIERLGMILDLAHLSDQGIREAFELYGGSICSTHSNSRSISNHERNLTDEFAREIAARGGVIGLNLLAPFIHQGWKSGDPQPAIAEAADHVEHLATICSPAHVGIGSDLDGGLTPDNTPLGIDRVDQLELLGEELARRGWSSAAVQDFNGGNWWRFLERSLPA
jgi:membrane dipeptidase